MRLSPAAALALEYLKGVLPRVAPHVMNLNGEVSPPVLVWSDGAYEGTLATVGFLIAQPLRPLDVNPLTASAAETVVAMAKAYRFEHGSAIVPPALMAALIERKQQIGQVEIIWGLCPYLSVPGAFRGSQVIHWIDNTSALAALTKGYSGVPDSARLVHAFHATNLTLAAQVWFEYIPSDSNPADEPSRRLDLENRIWIVASDLRGSPRSSPVPVVFPDAARLSDISQWLSGGVG